MERRELIQILAALPAATGAAAPLPPPPGPNAPRFFTAAEYEKLGRLTETLLPSEPGSPGARDANAGFFIDTVLHYASKETQAEWRRGLELLETESFSALAAAETKPATEAERFFVAFKRLTLEAFFHSDAAVRFFGYRGNSATAAFAACPGE